MDKIKGDISSNCAIAEVKAEVESRIYLWIICLLSSFAILSLLLRVFLVL